MPTKIEWTDETCNVVVGCSKCSPGCDNCYAEGIAARWAKNPKMAARYARVVGADGRWNGQVDVDFSALDRIPRKPKTVFIASMGDIFHPGVYNPPTTINSLFTQIADLSQHRFLLLTKRAEEMHKVVSAIADYRLESQKSSNALLAGLVRKDSVSLPSHVFHPSLQWPLDNLWLGVTVCNQKEADEKIPLLLATPAAGRFVSVEPMLGSIDLRHLTQGCDYYSLDALSGMEVIEEDGEIGPSLDWVIVGGETGPRARPMHPDWVRSLRDQCQAAGVPFFFKGWGEWAPDCRCGSSVVCKTIDRPQSGLSGCMFRCSRKKSGRLLDGVEHNEKPW